MSRPRLVLGWFLVLIAFLVIAVFSLHRVVDTDIWWHLKTGEYTLKERRLISEDIFSYTAGDQSGEGIELWLLPQWLSQVILYALYVLSGIPGLVLFKTAVLVGSFAILYLTAHRRANSTILVGCILLAAFTSHNWFSLRPYVFSLLFLVLYLYILERYRYGARNLIFLLPFIQIVWGNMHQGHVVGMVLIGCYLLGELIAGSKLPFFRKLAGLDGESYRRFLLFGGLALAAGLLSFRTPQVLLRLTGLLRAEGAERPFAMIAEWVSPFSPEMEYVELLLYKIMIGISALSFGLNLKRLSVSLLLVWVAFGFLSVTAHRNIVFFAPLCAPIIALNLRYFATNMEPRWSRAGFGKHFKRISGRAELAAQLLLTLFCLGWVPQLVSDSYYIGKGRPQRFGVGVSEISFPEKAVDFIMENDIGGNIFNDYDIGGYFIWRCYPRHRDFTDGRIVDPAFLRYYRRIIANPSLLDDVITRYDINCAILSHTSPDALGLIRKLYADRGWSLIYLDEIAAIFLLNSPENRRVIAQSPLDLGPVKRASVGPARKEPRTSNWFEFLLSKLSPRRVQYPFANLGKARLLLNLGLYQQAENVAREAVRENSDLAHTHYLLGRVHLWSGREDAAAKEYQRALEIDPNFANAHDDLGIIYAERGDYQRAIREFKKAIRCGTRDDSPHFNLGALYMRMKKYDDAVSEFKETVRINPRHARAHGNLGDMYLSKGLFDEAIEEYGFVLEADPTFLVAYLSLAAAHASRGQYERAIDECEKALRIDPEFAEAYHLLGDVYSGIIRFRRQMSLSQRKGVAESGIAAYEQFLKYWRGDRKQAEAVREKMGMLQKLTEQY